MSLFNMSSKAFKHWMSAYANPQDIEEIGHTNGNWKDFIKDVTTSDTDEIVDALITRPFAAFFYGYTNDSNEVVVQVVHHLNKNTPSAIPFDNIYHDAFGISGLQENRTVVEIDAETFATVAGDRQATPSLSDFIAAASDGTLFDALTPAAESTQEEEDKGMTAEGHPLPSICPSFATPILPMLVPPFGATPGKPLVVLKRLLLAVEDFGTLNLSAEGQILMWACSFPAIQHLWLLSQSSTANPCTAITTNLIPTEIRPTGTAREEKYARIIAGVESVWIEATEITPTAGSGHPATMDSTLGRHLEAHAEKSANAASQTAETLALLAQLQANNVSSGGVKSWEKRFNAKCRDFILFASATSLTDAPTEPTQDYKAFLESPKAQANSVAIQNINHQREGLQTIDTAMSTLLYGVEFVQNTADDHPRGLSLFCAVSAPVLGAAASLSGGELELLVETQKITHEQIKKLMTPTIQVPTTDNGLVETFSNGLASFDFVFGKESLLYKCIERTKNLLIKHKRHVAIRCARDKNFISAIMALVDIRVQQFLKSCTTASKIEDVDFSALEFGASLEEWLRNQSVIPVSPPLAILNIMKGGGQGGGATATAAAAEMAAAATATAATSAAPSFQSAPKRKKTAIARKRRKKRATEVPKTQTRCPSGS